MESSWNIRRCIHHHELAIRIPADNILELRDRRHFGLTGPAAGTEHEQAAVRVVEFYLKGVRVAAQFLERCRAYFQALQELVVTGPRPESKVIARVDLRIENL